MSVSTRQPLTIPEILKAVCLEFGVSLEDLRGESRTKTRANSRHVAMYLLRKLTDLSLVEIAEQFGNRHHSTVIFAIKKVISSSQSDLRFKHRVDRILADLYLNPGR